MPCSVSAYWFESSHGPQTMCATAEPQAGRFQCSLARPGEVSSPAKIPEGKSTGLFSQRLGEKSGIFGGKSVSFRYLEAIAKLFENASQWSWQDNAFVYLIVDPMLPLSLRIKSIPPTSVLFWTYRKTIISFLSPLKCFAATAGVTFN